MKLNFSPIKHPKVLRAILANGYSIKFTEEVQNFTKDSRYLHTKSLKRCKQRLTHNSSWFSSSSRIIITFIFNSELITAASSNRKGNNSINVKAEKQRKASGESNVSLGAVPTQTILQPQTVGKGWEAHKPISTRLTRSTKVLPQTADDKRALTHICLAHLITKCDDRKQLATNGEISYLFWAHSWYHKQQITNGHQPIFAGPDNLVPQTVYNKWALTHVC